jgi:hypothetical protein
MEVALVFCLLHAELQELLLVFLPDRFCELTELMPDPPGVFSAHAGSRLIEFLARVALHHDEQIVA